MLKSVIVKLLLHLFDAISDGIDSDLFQDPINLVLGRHNAIDRLCCLVQLCFLCIGHATLAPRYNSSLGGGSQMALLRLGPVLPRCTAYHGSEHCKLINKDILVEFLCNLRLSILEVKLKRFN